MPQLDTIIKNGHVVLPNGVMKKDIGIKDGKISVIAADIIDNAKHVVRADRQHIFPGMVDVHVHFNEPGREDWEGFTTGSSMMAAGGATTYFDMPLNGVPSTTNQAALLEKAKIGEQKSYVDFGLWGGLVPGNLSDLADLAQSGAIGFKAFLSETGNEEFKSVDDETLLKGMEEISRLNKVLALHSESGPITGYLSKKKKNNQQTTAGDYAETRPIIAEVEAVERAIHYAEITGCSLHFVHISSKDAVDKIQSAKKKGLDITLETCAHYLLFNHTHLIERGAVAKCAPPLREPEEQEKLVQLLLDDQFDMITSDHSPCPFSLKDPDQYNLLDAWGGISGGQFTLLSVIELALKHTIPLEKAAGWTAARPAKRFGLSTIGEINEGMEANLTIVDLERPFRVRTEDLHSRHKHSLFLDHEFPCTITSTYLRGQAVYTEEGHHSPPQGTWVKNVPSQ
ncbi:allantoinase [Halobacillus campisalis]|uniref:Allantoinase n=1 Tax=Halobacillus campisalis TaxID=435909 RepID=A0ABW2K9X3_9BACI|nr:allantoinase [Halobacillus campisalis]